MSDENTNQTPGEQAPEQGQQPQETQPAANPVEDAARAQGWVPKDEWDGDPTKWRDATTYLDRGELLGKIKSQSSEMRELKGMVTYLSEQNRRLYEAGYEKAIADLEALRDRAVEEGDSASVRKLDKQIREHEKALEDTKRVQHAPSQATSVVDEHFEEFKADNKWYVENEVMQDWANGAAVRFKARNPRATDQDIYSHLRTEVRNKFPDHFKKKTGAPSPDGKVARGNASTASRSGDSEFDALLAELPEAEADIARNLVKRKHLTKEEFIQSYKLIGSRR